MVDAFAGPLGSRLHVPAKLILAAHEGLDEDFWPRAMKCRYGNAEAKSYGTENGGYAGCELCGLIFGLRRHCLRRQKANYLDRSIAGPVRYN